MSAVPFPDGHRGAGPRYAGGDVERARIEVDRAEARLKDALEVQVRADEEAEISRTRAYEAKRAAEEKEAAAKEAATQVGIARKEAEARLAEWEAAKVANWKAA